MILTDTKIKQLVKENQMINPFFEKKSKNVISYGLGSYGYDIRLSEDFAYFGEPTPSIIDPKAFGDMKLRKFKASEVFIPAQDFILGMSTEYFKIPNNIMAICLGKSTYARCGVIVNVTPLEPGWEGRLVIEITNSGSLPVKVYANEGIAQIIFFKCNACEKPYNGLYQNQQTFGKSISP